MKKGKNKRKKRQRIKKNKSCTMTAKSKNKVSGGGNVIGFKSNKTIKKTNKKTKVKSKVNTKITKIKNQQNKVKKNPALTKLRKKIESEVDYTLDGSVRQLFLNLTMMQIPFNFENTLEPFFPEDIETDEHGNYFIKVGDTSTLFCAHLDTYCYEHKKVWHDIDDDIVRTDGTTTLGADDKAGVVIMLKMIEANVPGLYYFFRGEEGVTSPTGTWGSRQALKSYSELFATYNKCVAFDRRGYNSIITRQRSSSCCSSEFTNSLIAEFGLSDMLYKEDTTGMWCDSGVFMDTIPECTNISVGYEGEHTFKETQDLSHLEELVNACINIDWEGLPVVRDPNIVDYDPYDWDNNWDNNWDVYGRFVGSNGNIKDISHLDYYTKTNNSVNTKNREYQTVEEMFVHVVSILEEHNYDILNEVDFGDGVDIYFQNTLTKDFFGLRLIDFDVYISSDDTLLQYDFIGDLDTFERYVTLDGMPEYEEQNLNFDVVTENSEAFFSSTQDTKFKTFFNAHSDYMADIIKNITTSGGMDISPGEWIGMEDLMKEDGLEIDYSKNGINPDDFLDWVGYNWDYCVDIVK